MSQQRPLTAFVLPSCCPFGRGPEACQFPFGWCALVLQEPSAEKAKRRGGGPAPAPCVMVRCQCHCCPSVTCHNATRGLMRVGALALTSDWGTTGIQSRMRLVGFAASVWQTWKHLQQLAEQQQRNACFSQIKKLAGLGCSSFEPKERQ